MWVTDPGRIIEKKSDSAASEETEVYFIFAFVGTRDKKNALVSGNAGDEKNLFFWWIQLNFLNKVYTERTTLTELFFLEKQRVLPFKAEIHFKSFSTDRKKFLRHENIF